MIDRDLGVGYPTPRRASVAAILRDGLLPGDPSRRTTDREDCDGNVYVCEALGTPADAGVRGRGRPTGGAPTWRT